MYTQPSARLTEAPIYEPDYIVASVSLTDELCKIMSSMQKF